ncbi:unnamed protein product [Ceutorhynchus assimilis]|uniref:Uncharacterized protein n=1 Tax=Ceutorhynchus assimilis TaxID=467358 RepID=A0A9N9MJ32_9CUCU|nr:unnamed protein product [Ceutorhynchus assimilis]
MVTFISMIFASPLPYEDDQESAPSEHNGRVQIKVFRGPTEHDGHDHFAPWGYWVKQPGDDHH